jgi:Amt family ammonium transporter
LTQYGSGDYAWIMASAALVFMMIPGIALFYSGLRSQNTALSLIWLNMMVSSVVTIQVSYTNPHPNVWKKTYNLVQWYLFGYSLVFTSSPSSQFIGNFYYAVFQGTTAPDALAGVGSPGIPAMVFGLFQGMFAAFA